MNDPGAMVVLELSGRMREPSGGSDPILGGVCSRS